MSMSGDAYRDARRHGPDRAGLAAAGALTGGFGASACCILPLLLFSLGAGGVWVGRLGALSPYQPWFIGVAVLSLTYGFWRTYGARRDACEAGDACARPLPNRVVKLGLWSATALVATSLAFPYLVPDPALMEVALARIFPLALALLLLPAVAGAAEREATLSVDGMTCASCPYMVEQAPLQVERVAAASASMEDGSATVTFDDGVTDTESLVRAVERWGYGASLATVEGR